MNSQQRSPSFLFKYYKNVEFENNNNKFKFIVIIYGQGTYSLNWCSIAIVCREGI